MLQNALPVNEIHKISMFSYQFEHTLKLFGMKKNVLGNNGNIAAISCFEIKRILTNLGTIYKCVYNLTMTLNLTLSLDLLRHVNLHSRRIL